MFMHTQKNAQNTEILQHSVGTQNQGEDSWDIQFSPLGQEITASYMLVRSCNTIEKQVVHHFEMS